MGLRMEGPLLTEPDRTRHTHTQTQTCQALRKEEEEEGQGQGQAGEELSLQAREQGDKAVGDGTAVEAVGDGTAVGMEVAVVAVVSSLIS